MNFHIYDWTVNISHQGFIVESFFLLPIIISLGAIVKILRRAGFNGWWVLLIFVPIFNVLGLWYFAFGRWPALDKPSRRN